MSYSNAQFRNSGNDEGDILNYFNVYLSNLVQKNGGDNTFASYSEEFHNHDIPQKIGDKTRIMLTHPNHTISQFEKGFINMNVEFEIGFDKCVKKDKIKDDARINQIFVGFKDAVEIISEARFFVEGNLVQEYFQNEMIRESYAYNMIRSKDSKNNSPHSHSLWENVINMSPNVCGVYIPLIDLCWENDVDPKYYKVNMEIIIPFTDQLALQAWRLYPNNILGEIEEEIRTSLDGLVWCQLPPKNVGLKQKCVLNKQNWEYNAPNIPLTNHFTQIGQQGRIVSEMNTTIYGNIAEFEITDHVGSSSVFVDVDNYDENSSPNTKSDNLVVMKIMDNNLVVKSNSAFITVGRSNCFGFGIKREVLEGLVATLQEPIIIPAQELTRVIFDQKADEKMINVTKSIALRNATNITMMFPRSSFDLTVFRNIMYKNIQLIVDKKLYPHQQFDNTWDGRFVQYQLMANELDGIEATREFIESISQPLNRLSDGLRHQMSLYDDTNFCINFQLERGNAGYVFDGIDTNNREVLIQFRAETCFPLKNNPYLNPIVNVNNTNAKVFIPPPEMWICSDTYWTWSANDGVQYHKDGVPDGYK